MTSRTLSAVASLGCADGTSQRFGIDLNFGTNLSLTAHERAGADYVLAAGCLGTVEVDEEKQLNRYLQQNYVDASFGGSREVKSVTGYVFMLSGAAVVWASKPQITVPLHTAEAEINAAVDGSKELHFLKDLLSEIVSADAREPARLYENNSAAIALGRELRSINSYFERRLVFLLLHPLPYEAEVCGLGHEGTGWTRLIQTPRCSHGDHPTGSSTSIDDG